MIPRTFRERCLEVTKNEITILYKVLVFVWKQNQIRMKALKLQGKRRLGISRYSYYWNRNVIEKWTQIEIQMLQENKTPQMLQEMV